MNSALSGILLIDKPRGCTSHDVVGRVRRAAGMKQIGHTGTLDPMATGLLLVCLGPATRIAQYLVGMDKTYFGKVTFGAISDTYDAEGKITVQQGRQTPKDIDAIDAAMADQRGRQIQLPPPYSAIKVKGKKLYEYARSGEPIPLKPREVTVHRFVALEYHAPVLAFESRVASGTYIRSMAHELGIALGCGGYLSELRRTAVGNFDVKYAIPLETLVQDPELLQGSMLSVPEALSHLPKITLLPAKVPALLHGQSFTTLDVLAFDGILCADQPVLVIDERGKALSIARPELIDDEDDAGAALGATPFRFCPMKVLARPE